VRAQPSERPAIGARRGRMRSACGAVPPRFTFDGALRLGRVSTGASAQNLLEESFREVLVFAMRGKVLIDLHLGLVLPR